VNYTNVLHPKTLALVSTATIMTFVFVFISIFTVLPMFAVSFVVPR
jgi:hypothetical protein